MLTPAASADANERPSLAVSLVIPAFNEAPTLRRRLPELVSFCASLGIFFEVIVVDDGSTDGGADVVAHPAARDHRIQLVRFPVNRGKGAAVRAGVAAARGTTIVFTDGDFPYAFDNIRDAIEAVTDGADVVIGDRTLPTSQLHDRPSPLRLFTGWTLSRWLAATVFRGRSLPDTQCGLKAFRRSVACDLFARVKSQHFGFDIELLSAAIDRGYRIQRIPVTLLKNGRSHVRVVRDSLRMVRTVLRIAVRRRPVRRLPTLGNCPACRSTEASLIHRFGLYSVVDCRRCGLRHLTPLPTPDQLAAMYQPEYFESQAHGTGYADYAADEPLYIRTFQRRLSRLPALAAHQRMLDVGCGYGYGLMAAKASFAECWGCDVSPRALTEVRRRGFTAIEGPIEHQPNLPNGSFDLVMMDDLVEHLIAPHPFFDRVHELLRVGGLVSVTTPNAASRLARWSGRRWVSYKIPEHVVYYDPVTLQRLLIEHGFDIVDVAPAGQYVRLSLLIDRGLRLIPVIGPRLAPLVRSLGRSVVLYSPSGSMTVVGRRVRTHFDG